MEKKEGRRTIKKGETFANLVRMFAVPCNAVVRESFQSETSLWLFRTAASFPRWVFVVFALICLSLFDLRSLQRYTRHHRNSLTVFLPISHGWYLMRAFDVARFATREPFQVPVKISECVVGWWLWKVHSWCDFVDVGAAVQRVLISSLVLCCYQWQSDVVTVLQGHLFDCFVCNCLLCHKFRMRLSFLIRTPCLWNHLSWMTSYRMIAMRFCWKSCQKTTCGSHCYDGNLNRCSHLRLHHCHSSIFHSCEVFECNHRRDACSEYHNNHSCNRKCWGAMTVTKCDCHRSQLSFVVTAKVDCQNFQCSSFRSLRDRPSMDDRHVWPSLIDFHSFPQWWCWFSAWLLASLQSVALLVEQVFDEASDGRLRRTSLCLS